MLLFSNQPSPTPSSSRQASSEVSPMLPVSNLTSPIHTFFIQNSATPTYSNQASCEFSPMLPDVSTQTSTPSYTCQTSATTTYYSQASWEISPMLSDVSNQASPIPKTSRGDVCCSVPPTPSTSNSTPDISPACSQLPTTSSPRTPPGNVFLMVPLGCCSQIIVVIRVPPPPTCPQVCAKRVKAGSRIQKWHLLFTIGTEIVSLAVPKLYSC